MFIFCYIIFSQKTISNSSFVFTSLPNNGLCFTARKKWSHFSANSTFESSKSKSKETLFDSCIVLVSLCMHTWSSSNTCIFLILKSTLSRRIAAGFSLIFKYVIGSLLDLFNMCQLYISYTKYVKLFFKVLNQRKLFAWWH